MSEKQFPIQGGTSVPWSMAEAAYKTYAKAFGTSQSLERLAERGGFGAMEFAILLAGRTDAEHSHYRNKVIVNLIAAIKAHYETPR